MGSAAWDQRRMTSRIMDQWHHRGMGSAARQDEARVRRHDIVYVGKRSETHGHMNGGPSLWGAAALEIFFGLVDRALTAAGGGGVPAAR